MCGITGIINLDNKAVEPALLSASVSSIRHRGPDNQGIYVDGNIGLGHARLSIIDLDSRSNQPFFSTDKQFAIVFNGEIYNFKEVRLELEKKGYFFQTSSDTEVILIAWLHWKNACVAKLKGMFAFCIADIKNAQFFLARDRIGIKPLYYYQSEQTFVFASEIKALLKFGMAGKKVNFQALSEYMWYGNPLGANTFYSEIQELPPGYFATVSKKGFETEPYWKAQSYTADNKISENDAIERTRGLLEDAVKSHLIADVPVGVFLSGGIDSSAITAFAAKHFSGRIETFSAGFDFDKGVNELPKAALVARHFNTKHHELHISAQNITDTIEALVSCHDEPFADAANIPLYLLCKEIKSTVKVVLQGDGGDEVFGGYKRYKALQNIGLWKAANVLLSMVPSNNRSSYLRLRRFALAVSQTSDWKKIALLLTVETEKSSPLRVLNQDLRQKLSACNPFERYKKVMGSNSNDDLVQRLFYTDMRVILPDTFLEKVDKSTMAHGVEVRVPFLDTDLVEYALTVPSKIKVKKGAAKYLLKKALRGVVPDFILDAPKTGFGVPYSYWLSGPLYDYACNYLSGNPLFDRKVLGPILTHHKQGKGHNGFLIWKLLNLSIWVKKNAVSI